MVVLLSSYIGSSSRGERRGWIPNPSQACPDGVWNDLDIASGLALLAMGFLASALPWTFHPWPIPWHLVPIWESENYLRRSS